MSIVPAIIVDAHSHAFNAEDLPIDGFIKRLAPTPKLLTGLVSVPLDRLTQWVAPGRREAERIVQLLGGGAGLESLDGDVVFEAELVSDREIDRIFAVEWSRLGMVSAPQGPDGLEGLAPPEISDEDLAEGLRHATPVDLHELQGWLEEWDPTLADARVDGLEGLTDLVDYARSARRAVVQFVRALRLITRPRYQIAAELATSYPTVSLFTPALVDFSATTRDQPRTDVRQQIAVHSLVAKLSIVGLLPGAPSTRIAPFVGFDPYREVTETALSSWNPDLGVASRYAPYGSSPERFSGPARFDPTRARRLPVEDGPWDATVLDLSHVTGAIDLVRAAVEIGGFVGVKLYPPAGFLPLGNALRFPGTKGEQLDVALHALYGYCVAMDVPILAHAAHSNGFEVGYDGFAGPAGWELVLADYPTLRLCLGHFGHMHGVGTDPSAPSVDGWPARFVALIDRYPHVYADVGNSTFAISAAYRSRFVGLVRALVGTDEPTPEQQKRRRRMMYGSDFWMNSLSADHGGYLTSFEHDFVTAFDTEFGEAFMGRNALRFLGFTGDDDGPDPTNLNRRRYVAFHGTHPTPAWLPRGA